MLNTAELSDPRRVSDGVLRTRHRRDDLVAALDRLVYNLRWSWDATTVALFRALAPEPFARTGNPVNVLRSAGSDLDVLAEHAESILDRDADLDHYLNRPGRMDGVPLIAYFSAEFAIAEALPIYS